MYMQILSQVHFFTNLSNAIYWKLQLALPVKYNGSPARHAWNPMALTVIGKFETLTPIFSHWKKKINTFVMPPSSATLVKTNALKTSIHFKDSSTADKKQKWKNSNVKKKGTYQKEQYNKRQQCQGSESHRNRCRWSFLRFAEHVLEINNSWWQRVWS